MSIRQALEWGREQLKLSTTPVLDAEILLSHVLTQNRAYLLSHGDEIVTEECMKRFKQSIAERVSGKPIAYIIQKKEFYGLELYVNEHVLIPRPETETLVDLAYEEVINQMKSNTSDVISVVDVGTGSGCIGIALIHKIIQAGLNRERTFNMCLADISKEALDVAITNYELIITRLRRSYGGQANSKNIGVQFVESDLLKSIEGPIDIIVSNPPYIPENEIEDLDRGIKDFEPRLALSGGEEGLDIVKQLISEAVKQLTSETVEQLKPQGGLFMEVHDDHGEKIQSYVANTYPGWEVHLHPDEYGINRFISISRQ